MGKGVSQTSVPKVLGISPCGFDTPQTLLPRSIRFRVSFNISFAEDYALCSTFASTTPNLFRIPCPLHIVLPVHIGTELRPQPAFLSRNTSKNTLPQMTAPEIQRIFKLSVKTPSTSSLVFAASDNMFAVCVAIREQPADVDDLRAHLSEDASVH